MTQGYSVGIRQQIASAAVTAFSKTCSKNSYIFGVSLVLCGFSDNAKGADLTLPRKQRDIEKPAEKAAKLSFLLTPEIVRGEKSMFDKKPADKKSA